MKLVIILSGIEYNENLGLIARASKNFNCSSIYLVKPKADKSSDAAKSRAMHAKALLKKAREFSSLNEALAKVDYSVAATAVPSKGKGKNKKAISLSDLSKKFPGKTKVGIVFGRESIGLTNKETEQCDFSMTIQANDSYPTLNVSHAVAVTLYELSRKSKKSGPEPAPSAFKKAAIKTFFALANASPKTRKKKQVTDCFRRIISRGPATKKELQAVTGVLADSLKNIKKKS